MHWPRIGGVTGPPPTPQDPGCPGWHGLGCGGYVAHGCGWGGRVGCGWHCGGGGGT